MQKLIQKYKLKKFKIKIKIEYTANFKRKKVDPQNSTLK